MSRRLSQLNRWLARHGEPVTLRRPSGDGAGNSVTMRAKVKGLTAEQLIGGITQQTYMVVLSPTPILADGWPHGTGTPQNSEIIKPGNPARLPNTNDVLLIHSKQRAIQRIVPTFEDGECVRIEMTVQG